MFSLLVSSLALPAFADNLQLSFAINGIKSQEGMVYVSLFKGAENYAAGKAIASTGIKARKGDVVITFEDLAEGEYAIRFFHDENNNGKLEFNLFGLPVEGYGFSNNAKPNYGPVKYEAMKFDVSRSANHNQSTVIY